MAYLKALYEYHVALLMTSLVRWPQGFICPACKTSVIPWQASHVRLVCPLCRHFTYVSAGTIFDKTRTPLTTWFEAAWHVSTAKNGMSAKTLERCRVSTKFPK